VNKSTIDHLILKVNDLAASVDFNVNLLGFKNEGEDGPFTVIRVGNDFALQLAPWGTKGNEHYAFAMSREDFDKTYALIKEKDIPYGDSFHSVGNNTGPVRRPEHKPGSDGLYVRPKPPPYRNSTYD
jgi:catechol 2,3-dioxygenase-like lactoylglutathione lyase family enzyme